MLGKVKRRRDRRPKVSMVKNAGNANTKLTRPKPKDAIRAFVGVAPACWKIVEE